MKNCFRAVPSPSCTLFPCWDQSWGYNLSPSPASAGGNAPLNGNAHPMNNVSTSDKTTCTFMNTLCNLFGKLHPSRHTQVAGGPSVADGRGFVFKSPSFSHFILMCVIWCRFPALPWSNSLYKCASSGLPKEINHLQPRCHHSSLTGGTEQKQDTSQLFKDALWPSWCKNPKQFHKDVNCNLITATEIHLPVLLY